MVKRVVDAQHADGKALGVMGRAVDAVRHRAIDLNNACFFAMLSQCFVIGFTRAVDDDTGVSRRFNDLFGVDGVGVPELAFLHKSVAIIGCFGSVAFSVFTRVVPDVEDNGARFSRLCLHAHLIAATEHNAKADAEGETDDGGNFLHDKN